MMKNAIKILHIMSSAELGGGERYLLDVIENSDKIFEHIVVLPYKGQFEKLLDKYGYYYLKVNLRKKFSIKSLIKIINIVRTENIDIIHTHGFRANFYGRLAIFLKKIKHIETIHVSLLDYIDTPILLRCFYILVEYILSYKTSKYICVSNAMAEDTKKIGIPAHKIVVIMNGVNINKFHPRFVSSNKKDELGIDPKNHVIGTIGRMVNEKGQIYLIEAIKIIKKEIKNVQCIFLGNGPALPLLKKRASELKIEESCIFIGVRQDVELIYSLLDLFILPSLREPFGIVLLEAMASRVPVIATNKGGPCEYIATGINGVLVESCDPESIAIEAIELLKNKNRAQTLAENGEKFVKSNFNIKDVVKKIDGIYHSLTKI